jgi:ubiquinone/menaquinone biosynthesis C-methylase UbiE
MGERGHIKEGLLLLAPKTGEHVLEIGFGTGWALMQIAREVGDSGRVSGIDLSGGMHRQAMLNAQKAGLTENVELIQADAVELPYQDHQFDAVFMSFFLELIDTPEIPVVLAHCRRVLKSDGRMVVVSMAYTERTNLMVRAYMWAHKHFPALADCRPIRVERSLEEGGFRIEEARRRSLWGLPVDIVLARTSGYFQ